MYNVFIYLYQFGVMIASLFSEKVGKMWRGEREAFAILKERVDPQARYVWFHAASLGEFEQGRPIMERLRQSHPEYQILLTFFSPSGYEVRKNYEGADIICYLPLDTISNARKFLRLVRPEKAFFIKYEFWYNYLHILKHRNVPVYSVSSIFRPGQIFFRWYGHQYGRVLNCFTKFFVQNEESRQLLSTIHINNVEITGDTRFDRVLEIKSAAKDLAVVERFRSAGVPLLVAGSTWPPDEDILIKHINSRQGKYKMVLAPHVVSNDHLAEIEQKLTLKSVRYTQAQKNDVDLSDCDVLIIDCYGLLSSVYRYGVAAYVGGGFGVGIHNVLEAAVWDMPVIFGPNNKKFQEAQGLKACGGGFEIESYDGFEHQMERFFADASYLKDCGEKAGRFVKDQAGATELIMRSANL